MATLGMFWELFGLRIEHFQEVGTWFVSGILKEEFIKLFDFH